MKNNIKKLHTILLATGIPFSIAEVATITIWATTGNKIPFLIFLPIMVIYAIAISIYYFKNVAYICPHCHEVFAPNFREAFFAKHTPRLRKLRCPHCDVKSYCVETIREEVK